jgi:L-ribulokinase
LNRVYANVLNKPVLMPESEVTSLGSAIFAFLAAGAFRTVEEAQAALCPKFRTVMPEPSEASRYEKLYPLYKNLYFALGRPDSPPSAIGGILPALRAISEEARQS